MALTGHLSDLSLSELIEFFCNQRKTGRLKVLYPSGAGYFYLQSGSVVDARIGVLHGIDAVYYALTLPNASFEFSVDAEPGNRTINQPWTQVVLEGLRRLDENIAPGVAFPAGYSEAGETKSGDSSESENDKGYSSPEFLSFTHSPSKRKPLFVGAVVVAVLGSVAAIGVPAGWYNRERPSASPTAEATTPAPVKGTPSQTEASSQPSVETQTPATEVEDPAAAARRQRERERKAREAARLPETSVSSVEVAPKSTAKKVVVTVTYDESGRVTQASGGDANALRIARQKRFPPGKAGSATVTIPIN
ncbi:MAG TPA: DUF4388 domain-containing protein [Pyrinomonadaceae bacterium]|nr:DUF4388 domain-containing protein [Pyrinomonadaceae bacterium]